LTLSSGYVAVSQANRLMRWLHAPEVGGTGGQTSQRYGERGRSAEGYKSYTTSTHAAPPPGKSGTPGTASVDSAGFAATRARGAKRVTPPVVVEVAPGDPIFAQFVRAGRRRGSRTGRSADLTLPMATARGCSGDVCGNPLRSRLKAVPPPPVRGSVQGGSVDAIRNRTRIASCTEARKRKGERSMHPLAATRGFLASFL
jgi:hypothetical protein